MAGKIYVYSGSIVAGNVTSNVWGWVTGDEPLKDEEIVSRVVQYNRDRKSLTGEVVARDFLLTDVSFLPVIEEGLEG